MSTPENKRATFRQRDLVRALKALLAAGIGVKRVEVSADKVVFTTDATDAESKSPIPREIVL
jgi:hypothetical protein